MKVSVTASRNLLINAPSSLTILNDPEITTELVGMYHGCFRFSSPFRQK